MLVRYIKFCAFRVYPYGLAVLLPLTVLLCDPSLTLTTRYISDLTTTPRAMQLPQQLRDFSTTTNCIIFGTGIEKMPTSTCSTVRTQISSTYTTIRDTIFPPQ